MTQVQEPDYNDLPHTIPLIRRGIGVSYQMPPVCCTTIANEAKLLGPGHHHRQFLIRQLQEK